MITDTPRLISPKAILVGLLIVVTLIVLAIAGAQTSSTLLLSTDAGLTAEEALQDVVEQEGAAEQALGEYEPKVAAQKLNDAIGALGVAVDKDAPPEAVIALEDLITYDMDLLKIQDTGLYNKVMKTWQEYLDSK